jgi:hypothetical protein
VCLGKSPVVRRTLFCWRCNFNRWVVEVEVNLWPTVSRPVCLCVRYPSGTRDQFFFLLEISFRQLWVCYFVAPSLTRGQVCNLLYNCFWALPEQSLFGWSPAELTAILYFTVSSETPPTWRARSLYLWSNFLLIRFLHRPCRKYHSSVVFTSVSMATWSLLIHCLATAIVYTGIT